MPDTTLHSEGIHAILCMVLSDQKAAGPRVSLTEGSFLSSDLTRGGLPMVTYSDLIQVGILIVGICSLIVQNIRLYKKK